MKGNNNQLEKNTQPKGEITMKNKMSKVLKNEKGLTLIELLAVIVILAIVSAIAIPAIGNIIENSRYNAVKADAVNVINAANLYYTDDATKATGVKVSELIAADYLDNAGTIPIGSTVSKETPRLLTATVKVNEATVTFGGRSIDDINADKKKGSDLGTAYTVPAKPATP